MCVNAVRTRCQELGTLAQEDMGLATAAGWGSRHPRAVVPAADVAEGLSPAIETWLVCPGNSCWWDWGEIGAQHLLLEQDCRSQSKIGLAASRHLFTPKSFYNLSHATGLNETTLA